MTSQTKQQLRQHYLQLRSTLTPEEHLLKSRLIADRLIQRILNLRPKNVLLYYPIRNEVDLTPLFEFFWHQKISLFLPVTEHDRLRAAEYKVGVTLQKGAFQIPEPKDMPRVDFTFMELIVVPAVAIDSKKYRLGYGKGYYDRSLNSKMNTIGVCFDALLVDRLPRESFDRPLKTVLTEFRVLE